MPYTEAMSLQSGRERSECSCGKLLQRKCEPAQDATAYMLLVQEPPGYGTVNFKIHELPAPRYKVTYLHRLLAVAVVQLEGGLQ